MLPEDVTQQGISVTKAGVVYRQFSITIISAMALSVLVAIVVTPALCATILKPPRNGNHQKTRHLRPVQSRI